MCFGQPNKGHLTAYITSRSQSAVVTIESVRIVRWYREVKEVAVMIDSLLYAPAELTVNDQIRNIKTQRHNELSSSG